ncbi:MAG: Ig-like domain-containing protein, partial [bacterium]|nr:Ig-like domain-containing protein [bacterium]
LFKEEETGKHKAPPKEPVKPAVEKKAAPKKAPKPKTKAAPPAVTSPGKPSLGLWVLILVVFALQLGGLLEALRLGGSFRIPAIATTAFSFICLLGVLLKKADSRKVFLWVTVSWFAYVSYAGFYHLTSTTPYLLNFNLNQILGYFLAFAGGVVCLVSLRAQGSSTIFKIPGIMGWVLIFLGLLFSIFAGKTMEGNLWGPGMFSGLPLILRPGVLALSLSFVLLGLTVLLTLPAWRRQGFGMLRGPAFPLLLLCVLGSLLGAKLLARQGLQVPVLGKIAGEVFSGSTLLDPNQSSLRLILANEKPTLGQDEVFPLVVSANLSQAKGKKQTSRLMVRNLEGRTFADPNINQHLFLTRGDQRLKGGKASLDVKRLGQPRFVVVLVDLPSLVKTEVKASLTSAILHLGKQLDISDQLFLMGTQGLQSLNQQNESQWPKIIADSLGTEAVKVGDALTGSFKKIARQKGIKQIIYVTEAGKLPPVQNRQDWQAQAKKGKVAIDFVVLGSPTTEEEGIYVAEYPAALGFTLLSASASALGDYTLSFPKLPPLPKIQLTRDDQGNVDLSTGMISFQIQTDNPGDLAALTIKVDQDQPVDLDPKLLQQSIPLTNLKVKAGTHQFTITLVTQSGDEVTRSFEAKYVSKKPLQFVKPLDQDSVGGSFSVLISPARAPGLKTSFVELYVDGIPSGKATTPPYLITIDATGLPTGEHTFQAVQTFTDGKTEAVEIKVQANPSAPMVKIIRPSSGEYLSNVAEIEAEVGGGLLEQIKKVDYYVDGQWIGESNQAPHRFLWSNHSYPAGKYFIQARAQLDSGSTTTDAVQVQLAQGEVIVQADPAQSPTGMLFPDNVEVLIDASISMNEPLGKAFKIDLAKSALSEVTQAVPQNVKLITRVLGGRSEASAKNCQDSFRLRKSQEDLVKVSGRGTTPLAYALAGMGRDLRKTKGSRVGLLITDGWDRCGEDPIAIAQKLAKQKQKVRLHIIYFSDISPTNESLLKRLAEVTGGRTYRVARPEDLVAAIRDAVQVNFTLFDFKNSPVVTQALSRDPFYTRTGDYRLEVDTVPSVQKENVNISAGQRRVFTVVPEGDGYHLREE